FRRPRARSPRCSGRGAPRRASRSTVVRSAAPPRAHSLPRRRPEGGCGGLPHPRGGSAACRAATPPARLEEEREETPMNTTTQNETPAPTPDQDPRSAHPASGRRRRALVGIAAVAVAGLALAGCVRLPGVASGPRVETEHE